MDLPRPVSSRHSVNVVALNRAKVKYLKYAESKERYVGARFIIECGKKLDLDSVIVCTSCLLFHQFYANASKDTEHAFDQYLVAASCIYLASKLDPNANQLKLRDLINVVYTTLHRKDSGAPEEPLKLESQYYNIREAICHGELLVLRMSNFQTNFELPHKTLLHHLRSLKQWMSEDVWEKYPIARTSWCILQDFYHDPRVATLDCSHVSLACIVLALQSYGIQPPFTGSRPDWFRVFSHSLSTDQLWSILSIIMAVYDSEAGFVDPISAEYELAE